MTIVFVWTAGKRTSSIAARLNVAHKTRGSYKDDLTIASDRVDVFSIKRGRKRTYKGLQYFCQGHDRESGEHTFSCLTDILLRTSHWTNSNFLLNTRLIEAAVNIPKSIKKPKSSIWLIFFIYWPRLALARWIFRKSTSLPETVSACPHSSKNNFFEIKISQRRDWETPSLSYYGSCNDVIRFTGMGIIVVRPPWVRCEFFAELPLVLIL